LRSSLKPAPVDEPPTRTDRYYTKDRPPDDRNPFQRDRDRILFTSAFRRLAGVTQVFSAEEGQIFHNRLTHSLEVAQVGRRLAEKFILKQNTLANKLQIDPDVVESACLAHDVGHPPFGHIAEVLLDNLIKEKLPDGFEGNAQSFRIVNKLAFRSQDVTGLNLTRATLNALLKYPWVRDATEERNRKWSVYSTEQDEFEFARDLSPPGSDWKCPEAEIMDWADDITYSVHDMEDFYRANLIPLHTLASDSRERKQFYAQAEKRLGKSKQPEQFSKFVEVAEKLLPGLAIFSRYSGTSQERADLRTLTAGLINRYLTETTLRKPDPPEQGALKIPDGHTWEVKILKELTWCYVINNPALATQQYGQRKMITDLYKIYHELADDERSRYVFPAMTREQLEELDKEKSTVRQRGVTRTIVDLIAGMTEKQVVQMHRRLTGVSLGSALDYVGM
jgi:dGTPase